MNTSNIIIIIVAIILASFALKECYKPDEKSTVVEQQSAPTAPYMSYRITFEQWEGDMPTTITNGIDTILYDSVKAYELLSEYQTEVQLWADRETRITFQVFEHPVYKVGEAGPDSIERLSLKFPEYAR